MADFDWHCEVITRMTRITGSYRNTQNVRRYFRAECGNGFKFDRSFIAWINAAQGQTMGDAADEWVRRQVGR